MAGVPELPCVLCHLQEKSPWREAALCREAVSSTGQGKKWGISSRVHCAHFSPGGSAPFSCSPGLGGDRNSLDPIVGKGHRGTSQLSPQAPTNCSALWRGPSPGQDPRAAPGTNKDPAGEDPVGHAGEAQAWKSRATLTHGSVGSDSNR